ncbi:MAG: hypothetical protein H6842_05360 [Rhodospirillaceae bacterium]|nr:hypothetical protein [Rhodospirillaceae bacterium]
MADPVGQTLFTVVAPLRPGTQGDVRDMLAALGYLGTEPPGGPFGFEEAAMLHFASVFLYDDPVDGWFLVFESNIDGAVEPYLDRLLAIAAARDGGAFLLRLYGHCRGVAAGDLPGLKRHMLDHVQHPQAAFVSAVGLTRDRIRQDAAVYRVVDETLGSGGVPLPADQAQAAVLRALEHDRETAGVWSVADDAGPGALEKIRTVGGLVANVIGFVVLAVVNLLRERTAPEDSLRSDFDMVRTQRQYEDILPTNHMVSIVHLHTDRGRQWAKRCAFGVLRGLVTLFFRHGKLGKIETIHFAHWAILNGGRRLLFVSNFGGSWSSYLDDFTLKASEGLTVAWAHGIGFPRSWFMVRGGAAKGPEFIDWARRSMVPTPVWYKAYPDLSAKIINRNRKLRHALADAKAGRGTTAWLELV